MDTRQAFLGSMVMARLWPEAVQLFDTWRSYPERGPPRRHLERKSDLLPALQVRKWWSMGVYGFVVLGSLIFNWGICIIYI